MGVKLEDVDKRGARGFGGQGEKAEQSHRGGKIKAAGIYRVENSGSH